ncbi:MAG: fasciclin domain-containing protein [Armatimonadota bacterium]|nr:fasciclin domain-containing protein [Armatimonadota bacterium]
MSLSTVLRTGVVAIVIASVAVFGYVLPSSADVEGPREEFRYVQASSDEGPREERLQPLPLEATAMKNIVETAVEAGSFKTLVKAVQEAGLVQTLSGTGPFTVFAPTDEAFAKLPAGTLDSLLKDKQKLTAILTYHVVAGKVTAADVTKLKSAKTVNGQSITISVKDGAVMVDNAKVVKTDIMASNGVIHVIDTVILPK